MKTNEEFTAAKLQELIDWAKSQPQRTEFILNREKLIEYLSSREWERPIDG